MINAKRRVGVSSDVANAAPGFRLGPEHPISPSTADGQLRPNYAVTLTRSNGYV